MPVHTSVFEKLYINKTEPNKTPIWAGRGKSLVLFPHRTRTFFISYLCVVLLPSGSELHIFVIIYLHSQWTLTLKAWLTQRELHIAYTVCKVIEELEVPVALWAFYSQHWQSQVPQLWAVISTWIILFNKRCRDDIWALLAGPNNGNFRTDNNTTEYAYLILLFIQGFIDRMRRQSSAKEETGSSCPFINVSIKPLNIF